LCNGLNQNSGRIRRRFPQGQRAHPRMENILSGGNFPRLNVESLQPGAIKEKQAVQRQRGGGIAIDNPALNRIKEPYHSRFALQPGETPWILKSTSSPRGA
jgi:hypothetical protein